MGLLILISLLIEVGVLFYLEVKVWDTIYTPLNLLMLPYTVVVLVSACISGHFGFVEMYYPSILIWSIALLVFAIPSQCLGYFLHRNGKPYYSSMEFNEIPVFLLWISVFVCLALLYRLRQAVAISPYSIGTDDFGDYFDNNGLWAHVSRLNSILLIITVFFVDRKHKYLWFIIIVQLALLFIHNVKGWIFVPVVAGMLMRLCFGRSQFSFKFIFYVVLGTISVFFIIYILSVVVGQNLDFDGKFIAFIFRHVVHYLTSGVWGLSVDMVYGFPDKGPFELNIAQFVNMARAITGNTEYVSTINTYYYHTGFNYTNVRTLFGTIYINSNQLTYILTVLVLSSIIYLIKIFTIRFDGLYSNMVLYYFCSLLFMGWFDTFFSQLVVIEVPLWIMILCIIDKILQKNDSKQKVYIRE